MCTVDDQLTPEAPPHPADRRAPFGLPILAEVPELTALLEDLRAVDRLMARCLDQLMLLQEHAIAETATGAPLEQWLAIVARRTGSDRRMLATAAGVCRRLPTLHVAFRRGRLSWAQLRTIALQVERLPRHLDQALDDEFARLLETAADSDPDGLLHVVRRVIASYEPADTSGPAGGPEHDWVALQPRLDGTGGQVHGDFGPEGFALLDAALTPERPTSGTARSGFGTDRDPGRAREGAFAVARQRATRLLELCRTQHPDGEGRPVRPEVILRADLDLLLGRHPRPADLLTRLTGGVLHVDRPTALRLADRHGAEVRLILLDHGRVVGVGRTTRQPPGWLTDAILALHDTCTEPGCTVAARVCDTDHATPASGDGRTDIDNLAPVCAHANRTKERDGWQAVQTADGTRTWSHPRSGLSTRTLPATWRPPPGRPRAAAPSPG